MSSKILIKGATLLSEAGFIHELDLLIDGDRIARLGRALADAAARCVDASGWLILPGLVDLHAHLGEPGHEDRETLKTGQKAAAYGGFTDVLCMPDNDPPLDRESDVQSLLAQGARNEGARLHVCSALTKGRAGVELAELAALAAAGAKAAADAGPIADGRLVRRALEYARMLSIPIMTEARDANLSKDGVAHEGEVGAWLGLAGIPAAAEWTALARDLLIAESVGGRLHVQGVSTRRGVELIREAKAHGVRVSAECSFHNLILTDEALATYDTSAKLLPPLRPAPDVAACIEGVRDGTIDCIVSDHTPATLEEKAVEFDYATFGAAGLEVVLPSLHTYLVATGELSWSDVVRALSRRPRHVIGLPQPAFSEGASADFTLFNPEATTYVDPSRWQSLGRNTPLAGRTLKGRVEGIFTRGRAYGPWAEEALA